MTRHALKVLNGGVINTMVPPREFLVEGRETDLVHADGRPTREFRAELRRIPSLRNAGSVVSVYVQTIAVIWGAVHFGLPGVLIGMLMMGRAYAQFASLMHEAAHRLLFANRPINDLVGRWLLGYPAWTSTDAYRRVHMAHHREEFGPDEPDIPLYEGYPISPASMRRKLTRDATGRTGIRLLRQQLAGLRSPNPLVRTTLLKILAVQGLLAGIAVLTGHWWVYPVLWVLPFLTVWRVINRLRSIAEHGGMQRSKDRRETTHSVRQHAVARFAIVPYRIGWHLAHHVDSGIPFRHLPRLHAALVDSGYITSRVEYATYRALWRALRQPS
jgi:fatty acid desaturase